MGALSFPIADEERLLKRDADIITATDKYWCERYQNMFKEQIVVVGTPRYDGWWLKRINSLSDSLSEFNSLCAASHEGKIYTITLCMANFIQDMMFEDDKGNHTVSYRDFVALRYFLSKYQKESFYIFKFHPSTPRQLCEEFIRKFFPNANDDDYCITSFSVLSLAKISDVVISVGITTATTDALVMKTPTIELFDGHSHDYLYCCPDGSYGSFLKLHNLALHASNAEELCAQIDGIFNGEIHWDEYYERLKNYVMLDGKASKRMADLIMENIRDVSEKRRG